MKKYLLVRFSSIGDIILTSPVIRCLHNSGEAEIHYLTRRQYAGLVESNPYVSKVFTIERSIREVVPALRDEGYDMIIDLHRNIRTTSLLLRLRRPYSRFRKLNIRKWLLVRFKWNVMPDQHVVDRYLETIRSIGITYDGGGLDYFIPHDAYIDMQKTGMVEGAYACISAGSQHSTKQMPAELITAVISQMNLPVVLLGNADDKEKAARIVSMAQDNGVTDLTGQLSLDQSASVIKQSAVLITGDTGLMHMAAALNKRLVSVWGNTVPDFGMSPFFADGMQHLATIIQQDDLGCRPCSKLGYSSCPKGHFRCMMDIDPSRIAEEALN